MQSQRFDGVEPLRATLAPAASWPALRTYAADYGSRSGTLEQDAVLGAVRGKHRDG